MTLYPKLITDALEKVIYPGTKKNIIESEMLADTPSINGNKVSFKASRELIEKAGYKEKK